MALFGLILTDGDARRIAREHNTLRLKCTLDRLRSSRHERLAALELRERGGRNARERGEFSDTELKGSAGHPALGGVHRLVPPSRPKAIVEAQSLDVTVVSNWELNELSPLL
jgi:hypothetical protein